MLLLISHCLWHYEKVQCNFFVIISPDFKKPKGASRLFSFAQRALEKSLDVVKVLILKALGNARHGGQLEKSCYKIFFFCLVESPNRKKEQEKNYFLVSQKEIKKESKKEENYIKKSIEYTHTAP